ncbi:hypothetical protein B5X24_HaOG210125 [Helicoverpa armigera]|uniref:Peroxisomal leader peptide-processing protease n=1 Tax=Helicoverpa armigera TaxID=29058 RepID=A0A2W1BFM1_HELAM|nr:hypothetical protein B5X24_HaOG210125 [Helicoverpa armigera]
MGPGLNDLASVESLRPLSSLLDVVRPPTGRGSTVEVHSTPFGCEVFLNAVTQGSVCGVVGNKPSLLLTDAATALGSEGGPVFTEGPTKQLIGIVVCSVSWCRGEWVGLTLVAPLTAVLAAKLRYQSNKLSVYCKGVSATAIVRYKTPDKKAYDLALLFTNPDWLSHLKPAVLSNVPAERGESVLAAGFPYFNEFDLTNLVPTITSGHYQSNKLSVYCKGVSATAIVRYKTPDKKAYDLALLFTNPDWLSHLKPAVLSNIPAERDKKAYDLALLFTNPDWLSHLKPAVLSNVPAERVRYKTPDKKAYDLALLFTNPDWLSHLKPAVLSNVPAERGESVLAAGFPYFNEFDLTNLVPTITSGHVNSVSPSMIQTSCCVQSGFSGGPIVRINRSKNRAEVIGIIAMNVTIEGGGGPSFPYVNLAVPVTVFSDAFEHYMRDKDDSKLASIENNKDTIQLQWRLMPYRSKI